MMEGWRRDISAPACDLCIGRGFLSGRNQPSLPPTSMLVGVTRVSGERGPVALAAGGGLSGTCPRASPNKSENQNSELLSSFFLFLLCRCVLILCRPRILEKKKKGFHGFHIDVAWFSLFTSIARGAHARAPAHSSSLAPLRSSLLSVHHLQLTGPQEARSIQMKVALTTSQVLLSVCFYAPATSNLSRT